MSDNAFENETAANESGDNLSANEAQNDIMEASLAKELNGDDSISGTQNLEDKMEDSGAALEKLQGELGEMKDKYVRMVAEFDNFRKRSAKERLELTQTAGKDIIQSLLDVVDDSIRAQKQFETTTDIAQLKEGVSLVFNKLQHTLQQKGLKAMECINEPFDADMHEAITDIPAPSDDMVGKVIDVVQQGYYLNDKLIRHAKVVVGK